MKLVNLTQINIKIMGGETIPPSGRVARLDTKNIPVAELNGIKVSKQLIGGVRGLPDPVPGTYYIVSSVVRMALPERTDILSPGYPVRDESGKQLGCDGLIFNHYGDKHD